MYFLCEDSGRAEKKAFSVKESAEFSQKPVNIKREGEHNELAVRTFGPVRPGTVDINLNAILIRITKVNSFAHAVIGGAVNGPVRIRQTLNHTGEFFAVGHEDREMK